MDTADESKMKYEKPMGRHQILLPSHLREHAIEVGDGTLAEGVRICIERDIAQEEQEDD